MSCPNNHMLAAVLTTVVFIVLTTAVYILVIPSVSALFGVLAISKASKVKRLFAASLYREAEMASREAGMWCKAAWWLSITFFAFFIEIGLFLR